MVERMRLVDDVDIYVDGNFCMGWWGGFNRQRSLILRLVLSKVISNTLLLLRYEHKSIKHARNVALLRFLW